ncbi:GntR family transcriptional regulator [Caldanaerobius polysaccharolyticus]|uniref:GntR family transcriptional regulator n=1 Tax=Caldanaerobius polysaccharolyticus TaxID=44256 RepID=UPI00047EB8E0|nr:GntR family transcriptional regulator [Caldanaerobius polysaccharolyticus]
MFITISNTNPEPLYEQIYTEIKKLIVNEKLKPGDELPSIRELAKELTVSVITIKKAYELLEQEGLITTRQGLGSFVAQRDYATIKQKIKEEFQSKMINLLDEAERMGLTRDEVKLIINEILGKEELR